MNIKEFSLIFHPQYCENLHQRVNRSKELNTHPIVDALLSQLENLVSSPGKYIRPYLVNLMYTAHGGNNTKEIMSFMYGVELFHLFCLVHDDVMDHADTRRGVATIQSAAQALLQPKDNEHGMITTPESLAVLIGDLLLMWAHEEFSQYTNNQTLGALLVKMQNEVTEGQMFDLLLCTETQSSREDIIKKTELKTAYYSFIRPMQFGVALASGSKASLQHCEDFGRALGTSFQIRDDLINIVGTKGIKSTPLGDLIEGQKTLFTYAIEQFGTEKHKQQLADLCNQNSYTENDIALAHNLFRESGAFAYVADYADTLFKTADDVLSHWDIPQEQKGDLQELTTSLQTDFKAMLEQVQ